jgi:branched-chain amino acid transport system substrate-binding protein
MTKKILALVLVLCMVVPFVVACGSGSTATTAPTTAATTPAAGTAPAGEATWDGTFKGEVKVGVLCSLTGSVPLEGLAERNAAELIAEQWNATGGINGYKIVLQIEDDANDNTATLTAATKLVSDQDIKVMVGPIRSAGCKAMADVVAQNKIVSLIGGTSPSLVGAADGWMFRYRTSDTDMGTVAAKYLADVMGVTKLGILYNNDDYGNGARGVIVDYLENNTEVEVAVQEGHNTGDKDMTAGLLAVKDAGCDGMILWTHSPEGAVIIRQYNELGLADAGVKFLGGPIWGMGGFYQLVEDNLVNGTKGVMEFTVGNEEAASKAFVEAYKAKYNEDPLANAAYWYDGLTIAFKALELCGEDFSRENVKAQMSKVDFQGITGHIYLGENGFDFVHQVLIGEISAKDNVKSVINVELMSAAE